MQRRRRRRWWCPLTVLLWWLSLLQDTLRVHPSCCGCCRWCVLCFTTTDGRDCGRSPSGSGGWLRSGGSNCVNHRKGTGSDRWPAFCDVTKVCCMVSAGAVRVSRRCSHSSGWLTCHSNVMVRQGSTVRKCQLDQSGRCLLRARCPWDGWIFRTNGVYSPEAWGERFESLRSQGVESLLQGGSCVVWFCRRRISLG